MTLVTPAVPHPAPTDRSPTPPRVYVTRGAKVALFFALLAAGFIRCPLAFFVHVPCPGCGITRATYKLLEGDIPGALAYHPLVFVMLPALLWLAFASAWKYVKTGEHVAIGANSGKVWTAIALVALAVMLGVWIARFFGAFGGAAVV